jgi:maleate cis-trans isomerase
MGDEPFVLRRGGIVERHRASAVGVFDTLEQDFEKPVLSSNRASFWQALRLTGTLQTIRGFGSLLRAI